MLIIFGRLPGVGKTTIAKELARQIGAIYLRIDSIEQAVRDCDKMTGPLNELGYRIAYAIAKDNLLLGRTVVTDSVNPLLVTREAWADVASGAGWVSSKSKSRAPIQSFIANAWKHDCLTSPDCP